MIYNDIEFKPYDEYYWVSANGDIYSSYIKRCMKHNIDLDGYHRVDIHGKHMKVHKLVFLTWISDHIPAGKQINHKDDNKNNNHYLNLYLGNQQENISDCMQNDHRCGNVLSVTIFNKQTQQEEYYPAIKDFLETTGHSVSNGSLTKVRNRKWFQDKYEIRKLERCRDYRKLTASRVVGTLSPDEAQGAA